MSGFSPSPQWRGSCLSEEESDEWMEEAEDEPENAVNFECLRDKGAQEVGGEENDDSFRVENVRAEDGIEGVGS